MNNNGTASTSASLIEPMRMEEYEALKALIHPDHIKAVHMTRDFYLQLMASGEVETRPAEPGVLSLIGYPVIVHNEYCRREWWFEYDEDIAEISKWRMISKNWFDRDKWFTHPTST